MPNPTALAERLVAANPTTSHAARLIVHEAMAKPDTAALDELYRAGWAAGTAAARRALGVVTKAAPIEPPEPGQQ
ncbi:MAG: hypothetical protein IRZ05_18285, partial [Micromonosporaceae bacterium]|nr:hypothetical protein [Micromonosporaceae bacterium]